MVTSRLNKFLFLILLLIIPLQGCTSDCPERFQATFSINNWHGNAPKTVEMMRYKKNSNFKIVEHQYPAEKIIIGKPVQWEGDWYLDINIGEPVGVWLTTNSDYKLILDNDMEYRFTDFVSTNEKRWGCPLKSFKVNNYLHAGGKASLNFKKSIGEPVNH